MIRRLDSSTQMFLTALSDINRRVDSAQRAAYSGKRINQSSDAPNELSNLLQLRTEVRQTEQIRSNLGRVTTEVDSAEASLEAAVEVLERAAVLGTQGANGTMEDDTRAALEAEVEVLLQEMVGLARTRVESRYVFSGDADGQEPFTLDLTLDDPVSDYLGGTATREVMHPAGTEFRISLSADEIFDNADPSKNVFQAINNLRLGLQADDQDAIAAALEQISSAQVHLNSSLAYYGAVQNQVLGATEFAYQQELRLNTRICEIEDADSVEAFLELNAATYQQSVALAVKAEDKPTSLFDYIA